MTALTRPTVRISIAGIGAVRHFISMAEIATVVCPHVLTNERPVRLLIHHGDGTWQATCGQRDHAEDCSDFEVVGINHLFERQPDMTALATLPPNYISDWSDGRWTVSPFDEGEAD
jgi:hypothetical protein